jgi:hypothetical protein
MTNLYADLARYWHRRTVEPVKRKHGSPWPEWQHHRFEIKDGITPREAMIRDMSVPNSLLEMIRLTE